nr:MAG TPA: hypothetical protein [Caudoviricetes sp.]
MKRWSARTVGHGRHWRAWGLIQMNRNRFLPLSTGAAGNNIYNLSLRFLCLL